MLKAIIFDMDGLMVDTEIISFQCYKDIIESYGFNFTKRIHRRLSWKICYFINELYQK
ncbi:MAG: HAD hydrolase-like protein [Faecalibacillus intestinalis]|uniref:HAD hydrolase-like protein n=1 Tax=Faecalibacillus intestinalis TaxID=1982626 RepID=UPI0039A230E1